MEEAINLGQKLGALGFGTLMFLILTGSYFDVWRWGKVVREQLAARDREVKEQREDYEKRLVELKADRDEWKQQLFIAARLLDTSVSTLYQDKKK